MWEAFGNWLNNNKGALDGIASLVGNIGGAWGAYNQQKMAKKNFALQQDAYNYNKMLSEEERKRRDIQDKAINQAFANSTLSQSY